MFTSRCLPLAAAVTALALLAGCANNNPYDTQSQSQGGMSKTAKYGGLGALAGAVAGAAIDHNNRGKGALIGAAVAGAAAAGYGYYADKQEAELRRQMEGTGVEVQRQGDDIKLIMPGNITFATDSANIAPSFYAPLNNLANSFKQYNQNTIEIVGYTDSTGSRQHNMARRRPSRSTDRGLDEKARHSAGFFMGAGRRSSSYALALPGNSRCRLSSNWSLRSHSWLTHCWNSAR